VHASSEDAENETKRMLNIYKKFFEEYLAIPVITGRKTELEKFSGADYTLTIESLMYNGVSLQSATSHYFGQRFAKAYDIKFLNKNNELEYAYQTSWGASTRMIGGLIMVHSDDNGLVLPPKIAPKQVVIIPIGEDIKVKLETDRIYNELKDSGISVYIDNSDKTPGFKFAEAEVNGIPVRIEVGLRDIEQGQISIVRRDTREKMVEPNNINISTYVKGLMKDIQNDLYTKAKIRRDSLTYECTKLEEVEEIMKNRPGFVKAMWCGDNECELKMKEVQGTKSRCILEHEEHISNKCIVCGKKAKHLVLWGIQY